MKAFMLLIFIKHSLVHSTRSNGGWKPCCLKKSALNSSIQLSGTASVITGYTNE